MATANELEAKLKLVEAERDELARQLAGIRDQFAAVKRAYLSNRTQGAPDPRVAELEAELVRIKNDAANERARLQAELDRLKLGPQPKPRPKSKPAVETQPEPAPLEPSPPGTPDPRQILKRLADED